MSGGSWSQRWVWQAEWLFVRRGHGRNEYLVGFQPGELPRLRVCQLLGVSPVVAGVRGPAPYRHRRRWRGRPRR